MSELQALLATPDDNIWKWIILEGSGIGGTGVITQEWRVYTGQCTGRLRGCGQYPRPLDDYRIHL